MKFQVAKQDLEAALQVVTPSLNSSGSDITTHFVFRRTGTKDDGYGVEVVTCAGRVFSSCPMKVKVDDPGKKGTFTIEGKRLKAWLANVANAALTFSFNEDEGEVTAKAPRGRQTFQSLQPDARFSWDDNLKEAKLAATLSADRLANALGYIRHFISVKESERPDLCVCEVKENLLGATDQKALTVIRIEDIGEAILRIHGKDVAGFKDFLGTFDGTNVEVLEHDRVLILRRGDGAMFGSSRFQAMFPGFKVGMDDEDQHKWVINKAELAEAIGFLTAGATWEDNRLTFAPSDKPNEITLSMMSATGKKTTLPVACVSMDSVEDAEEIPDTGFALDHFVLDRVLKAMKFDEVTFGVTSLGSRGFVRFVFEYEGDKYLTMLAWLR